MFRKQSNLICIWPVIVLNNFYDVCPNEVQLMQILCSLVIYLLSVFYSVDQLFIDKMTRTRKYPQCNQCLQMLQVLGVFFGRGREKSFCTWIDQFSDNLSVVKSYCFQYGISNLLHLTAQLFWSNMMSSSVLIFVFFQPSWSLSRSWWLWWWWWWWWWWSPVW